MLDDDTRPTVDVFIASSHTAKAIAHKLANELTVYESTAFKLSPVRWWQEPPGSYILDFHQCVQTKKCDFAAILLTETNVVSPTDQVRDNCIYEAGLFTSALGGDPQRCFLVVSCDRRKLPSDLAGLTYIPIVQEGADVDEKIRSAANKIGQRIDNFAGEDKLRVLRGLPLPTVTLEELIRKEQPVEEGGLLRQASTNIFASAKLREQPSSGEYTRRIFTNLSHGVEYMFVTEASERNLIDIARFFGMLAASGGSDELGARLKVMHSKLEILLVECRSLAIEYCVYYADDPYSAICYLRLPELGPESEWIEWAQGGNAIVMTQEVSRLRVRKEQVRIFDRRFTATYTISQM